MGVGAASATMVLDRVEAVLSSDQSATSPAEAPTVAIRASRMVIQNFLEARRKSSL